MSTIDECRQLYEQAQRAAGEIQFSSPFRLLVTGSRNWGDATVVRAVQYGIAAAIRGPVVQTDGACATGGLDVIAFVQAEFHLHRRGWEGRRVPADWFAGWRSSGRNPGHERNQKMVDMGHDLCVGFPDPHRSPGTWDCMTRAYMANIPTYAVMRRRGIWMLERFEPQRVQQGTIELAS